LPALTFTKILGDIDTVAIMGYAEAENRNEFIREYCTEVYGHYHPIMHHTVARAFKDTASIFGVDTGPRHTQRNDYRSIQMEALY
jgi:hypothetical protein